MIAENMRSFKEDVAPFLEKMREDDLDSFGSYLLDLEMLARKAGDKKQADRLRRIGNHVSEMIAKMWSKEKPPQKP
jgi:hypothetical protein